MCWMFSNLFMAGNHDFSCLFPSTACFPSLSHCWFLCLCVLLSCPYLWSCLCVDCFFEKQKNKKTEGVAISKESQRHKLWMCFDSRDLGWNEVPFSRSSLVTYVRPGVQCWCSSGRFQKPLVWFAQRRTTAAHFGPHWQGIWGPSCILSLMVPSLDRFCSGCSWGTYVFSL